MTTSAFPATRIKVEDTTGSNIPNGGTSTMKSSPAIVKIKHEESNLPSTSSARAPCPVEGSQCQSRQWLRGFHAHLDGLGTRKIASRGTIDNASIPTVVVHDVGRLECPLDSATLEALQIVANTCHEERMSNLYLNTWPRPATPPPPPQRALAIDAKVKSEEVVTIRGAKGSSWDDFLKTKVIETFTNELGFPLVSHDHFISIELEQLIVLTAGYDEQLWTYPDFNGSNKDLVGIFVVQLPTDFRGGELLVRNSYHYEGFDMDEGASDQCNYVAFFPDCPCLVLSITRGVVVRLYYHISLSKRITITENPHAVYLTPAADHLAKALEDPLRVMARDWKMHGGGVARLGYKFDHDYYGTFNAKFLKGRDRLVYAALLNAKKPNGDCLWDIHLVVLDACLTYPDQENNPKKRKGTPRLSRDFQVQKALDREGDTVKIVFNRSDGTTDGALSMQQDGWLMDAKYFGAQNQGTADARWQFWATSEEALKDKTPSQPAAIFIAPAKPKTKRGL